MKSLYLLILSFFLVSNAYHEGIKIEDMLDTYYTYPHTKIIDYIKLNYITACEILAEAVPIYYDMAEYEKAITPSLIITCSLCKHPFFTYDFYIDALLSHCIDKMDTNEYSKHKILNIIQKILAALKLQPEELFTQLTILAKETSYHCSHCHKAEWQFFAVDESTIKQLHNIAPKKPGHIFAHCNYDIMRGLCIFNYYEFLLKARIRHEALHQTSGSFYCSHCKKNSFSYQDFTDEILLAMMKTMTEKDNMEPLITKLKPTMIGMTKAFSHSYNKTARTLIHYAHKNKLTCSICKKKSWQFTKKTGNQTLTNFSQKHPEQCGLITKKKDYATEIMQLNKEIEIFKKKAKKNQPRRQKNKPKVTH